MFQSFITSLDNSQPIVKFKKEQLAPKDSKFRDPGRLRNPTREVTRKDTFLPNDASFLKSGSHERLKLAIEEELALRNRLRHYNSTDKISKKQDILKKRVEKAKSMNKRALKVYRNYKEKEEKSYDFFKIETLYKSSQTEMVKPPTKPHFKKFLNESEHSQAQGNSLETLKIPHDGVNTSQCRTAGVKTRTRYIFDSQSQSIIKRMTNNDRFLDYKKKEQQTREKKMELQRTKEEQSLYRLIKKNERLNELELKNQQEQEKQSKRLQKLHQQSLLKQPTQQLHEYFDISIRDKCQEKVMRKEMQLQEQVNRIREDFRAKQERREKHRTKMERQHYQKMSLNELRLKEQIQRRQVSKENDHRHQMTIKQRHQMLKEKEKQAKIINTISKLTDQELQRSIKRLNNSANPNIPKPIYNSNLT